MLPLFVLTLRQENGCKDFLFATIFYVKRQKKNPALVKTDLSHLSSFF